MQGERQSQDGDGSGSPHHFLARLSRQASHAALPSPAANAAVDTSSSAHISALLEELRATLAPFIVSTSDQSQVFSDMERIACALKAAVVGSAALPQTGLPLMTAQDALSLLCDPKNVST